jgi:hypothetical protein
MADHQEVRAPVDRNRLVSHIDEFSLRPKHAGTPTELESLRYVQAQMRAYGFRTDLISHPAYISLPGLASVGFQGRRLRAITHSFSRPSDPEGLTAQLVYVGAGRPEDYAGADVKGRLMLVDGVASPMASVVAGERGAVGQVHVSPHRHLHEMCISPVWGSPGDDQLAALPSTVVVSIPAADGAELKAALDRGPVDLIVHAEMDTGWRDTPILVADLASEGGGPDEPFVLLTGHHDTWYLGVMDNGGANATMLEVSRLCAGNHSAWRRGLRVIYWSGHSQGRYSSSAWYADNNWFELQRRAVVHVNVDSTGGLGNTVVSDTAASAELRAVAREALREEAGQEYSGRRMQRAGDQSFWGIGVPSIFGNMSEQPAQPGEVNASAAVFGGGARAGAGTGWWWHTPDDTRDKIDPDILVRDTRIYLRTVWRLLTEPVLPIDYREHARELRTVLEERSRQTSQHLDLEPLVEFAARLESRLAAIYDQGGGADPAPFNELIRSLSRALVPIDYTRGDRFCHDPALSTPAVPALADCARLAGLQVGSVEALCLASRLKRAANRVENGLREALTACDEFATHGGAPAKIR